MNRPPCSYCGKKKIDHLGPNLYCTTQGTTSFTTDKLMRRKVAVNVIAGMIATAQWLRDGCPGTLDLTDPAMEPFVKEADEMLYNAEG